MPRTDTINLVDVEQKDIREIQFVRTTTHEVQVVEPPEGVPFPDPPETEGPPVEIEVWTLRVAYQVRDDAGNIYDSKSTDTSELDPGLHGRMMSIVNVDVLPLINDAEGM